MIDSLAVGVDRCSSRTGQELRSKVYGVPGKSKMEMSTKAELLPELLPVSLQ